MSDDDLVLVGRVGRPHGVQGAFVVEQPSEAPDRFACGARLLAGGREVEVVESKVSGGRRVIRLDVPLERGTPLEVRRADLPPLGDDTFYVFQLVGLEVVEEGEPRRVLGSVERVDPGVANDVLVLAGGIALPLVEDCVRSIALDEGRIVVAPGFAEHG